ncbi:dTDP-4-dehydrorhamnose reductase [Colwellia sp. MB02u-18]|uniref:dTDP-4-dehydrorhamnose reductase n=1 Tax=unclassified Colwellia TaxID=196834 RepID=UPI0015F5B136|nr:MULTISPECIES: dTDP-4-dehydrorhamnose reductase [unclassified Colwellia]MBA6224507.1 dTDP-4-dehydrorhamnose reductase [Colwellia sp. MB3u-45]MBA6267623.1 dTDP-4-dehydrorhamnose reductase [Colwellia sp. MB3u-43]MBA6322201.1 dTDP-4-dehydrorhamnose reductase [Colwellia sp. MB02u-19]MBA6326211.1 dTDP-4-dehydrorhamnose reductase [Colwellia sp. MB02u-18]MBA6331670.1 dTDP-4-dehydrorhamnose reductase [Colwellia sp. MB02u-12]
MKIIVIGKSGQLAWELSQLSSPEHEILCLGRNDIDLQNIAAITHSLQLHKAAGVINASAYTGVDKAESDVENAYALNAKAVGNLAQACKILSVSFVHISTDFVFHGDKGAPYLPEDEIRPLGIYGASKAQGEQLITQVYPERSTIIRTSWVYSTHGNNFVKTMLNLMNTKPELGIISDQIGSPTYAKGLAAACIASLTHNITGIHHYTDTGVASWFDFAVAIQNMGYELGLLTKKIPIKPITTAQYPTPAKRPHYSVLDKSSLMFALPELSFVHWQAQLATMMHALKAEQS